MSFVKTLATLAVGFAASKGYDKFKQGGGMAGLQDAMKDNPAMSGMADQMGSMLEKFGVPGGAAGLEGIMGQLTGAGGAAADQASAGLGGLMAAMGGAAATGQEQTGQFLDALSGNKVASTAMEDNAKLMIRAMIQAAKADGEIDDDERARILDQLGDIDAEERAFVQAELAAPIDVQGLANDTSEAMRAQVYATSLMAVKVDTNTEATYLNNLANALGLSDQTRQHVHRAMGLA